MSSQQSMSPSEQCEESQMVASASAKGGFYTTERSPLVVNMGIYIRTVIQMPISSPGIGGETSTSSYKIIWNINMWFQTLPPLTFEMLTFLPYGK